MAEWSLVIIVQAVVIIATLVASWHLSTLLS
jgi:hypothetical protein